MQEGIDDAVGIVARDQALQRLDITDQVTDRDAPDRRLRAADANGGMCGSDGIGSGHENRMRRADRSRGLGAQRFPVHAKRASSLHQSEPPSKTQ